MPAATSPLADPAWRHQRAVKAAAVAHTTDVLIKRLTARAAELTAEQREQLLDLGGARATS